MRIAAVVALLLVVAAGPAAAQQEWQDEPGALQDEVYSWLFEWFPVWSGSDCEAIAEHVSTKHGFHFVHDGRVFSHTWKDACREFMATRGILEATLKEGQVEIVGPTTAVVLAQYEREPDLPNTQFMVVQRDAAGEWLLTYFSDTGHHSVPAPNKGRNN